MGRISKLDIILDGNKKGFFYPGEELKGRVVFWAHGRVTISKIIIHIKGRATCGWVEKRGHLMQNFVKNKELINEDILALESKDSDPNSGTVIRAGEKFYRFSYVLPKELPTNFKSRIGFIKYCIKAYVERPWRPTLKCKHPFTVVEPIELRKAALLLPLADERWREINKCHTHDNQICLEASLDKEIYRPGEKITVRAECNNKTGRCMRIIKAKLIKVKEYHSTKIYTESRTIAKEHGPSIAPHRLIKWETFSLICPRTAASILSCKVLRLSYVVEVQLVVPFGYNLKVRLPVIIGNVPLNGNQPCPILHGLRRRHHRIISAVDLILRPKRKRHYNRLTLTADSLANLEEGHEVDEDDIEDSIPDDASDDWDSVYQKNSVESDDIIQSCKGDLVKPKCCKVR